MKSEIVSLVALCMVLAASPSASADTGITVEGAIEMGSDYAFRGVSQTRSQANVQAALSASHRSGLFADVWLSSAAFEPGDGVDLEVDFTVGYYAALSGQWSGSVALVSYLFPGAAAGVDYDYREIIATLGLGDSLAASVAWSPDAFGEGAPAANWEVAGSFPLAGETALELKYGFADLDRVYGDDYAYYSAGLAKQAGNIAIELAWHNTSESAAPMFGRQITGARLILTAGVGF